MRTSMEWRLFIGDSIVKESEKEKEREKERKTII